MRPGCGLKFREGWFLARHTPPSAPTAGGKDPAAENPKASSTVQTGFALRTLPRWKKKQKKRKRERERVFLQRLCEVLVGEMVFQLTTLMYLIFSMLLSQSRLQQTSLIGRAAEPQTTTTVWGAPRPSLTALWAHTVHL